MNVNSQKMICIGSVLWDIIGKTNGTLSRASDVPGQIKMLPGGVAFNIAQKLSSLGYKPTILSAIGKDQEGQSLIERCDQIGLDTRYIFRPEGWPTDRYMAIEDCGGVVAAIADAHSLEAAGDLIFKPLKDGRLGSLNKPFDGVIVLDGNLSEEVLEEISISPYFSACDLRLCPASPGKGKRLKPFLGLMNATFYCNLQEAEILCEAEFETAEAAVVGLLSMGAKRAIVTHGGLSVCDGRAPNHTVLYKPPKIEVKRVTGAGDTFMAVHIAAEMENRSTEKALQQAVEAAAAFVNGKDSA